MMSDQATKEMVMVMRMRTMMMMIQRHGGGGGVLRNEVLQKNLYQKKKKNLQIESVSMEKEKGIQEFYDFLVMASQRCAAIFHRLPLL